MKNNSGSVATPVKPSKRIKDLVFMVRQGGDIQIGYPYNGKERPVLYSPDRCFMGGVGVPTIEKMKSFSPKGLKFKGQTVSYEKYFIKGYLLDLNTNEVINISYEKSSEFYSLMAYMDCDHEKRSLSHKVVDEEHSAVVAYHVHDDHKKVAILGIDQFDDFCDCSLSKNQVKQLKIPVLN